LSRLGTFWAATLFLVLAILGGKAGLGPDESPHGFMAEEAHCADCHEVEPDGEDLILEPHRFTVPVVGTCRECHPAEQMGRSHPVDVAPRRTLGSRDWPEELPLHWSDDARSEVLTCGTCHNPHLPRLSIDKLYSLQRPWEETGQYLTYYLRMRGQTPREGFTPLCHACHPGL